MKEKIKNKLNNINRKISLSILLLEEIPKFLKEYIKLKINPPKNFSKICFNPILGEKLKSSGTMSGHYFHQDLFVAREIFKRKPFRHIDIGSRTDGFIAHVASFREIDVLDIRQQEKKVKGINCIKVDLTNPPKEFIKSCDSISSLHSIEHFGLGRYGDNIDTNGHLKAIINICSMLKKNGIFYFSVPIGSQRVEFNAHRVFSIKYLLDLLIKYFKIESFSYVNDKGDFFENAELTSEKIKNNLGCKYGCGIFILKKK